MSKKFEVVIRKTEIKEGTVCVYANSKEEAKSIVEDKLASISLELEGIEELELYDYSREVKSIYEIDKKEAESQIKIINNELINYKKATNKKSGFLFDESYSERIKGDLYKAILISDDPDSGYHSKPEIHLFIANQNIENHVYSIENFKEHLIYLLKLSSYVNKNKEYTWSYAIENLTDLMLDISGLTRIKPGNAYEANNIYSLYLDAHEKLSI